MGVKEQFLRTVKEHKMLEKGDKVLVGVSGGADSLCLLHLLTRFKEDLGIKLHVAHLDHMFRGEASRQDADFVKDICEKWGIPICVGQRDVPQLIRETGLSPEDAARRARYAFYEEVRSQIKAQVVATGHNRDDNEETILMNILRGTGPKGLMGIDPVRLPYIRPIIEIPRTSIEKYLEEIDLSPRVDATNLLPKYFRNRLRIELIPHIKTKYCPHLGEALLRLSHISRAEQDYLDEKEDKSWQDVARVTNEGIKICKKNFQQEHRALKSRILRRAFAKVVGDLKDLEFRHIENLMEFISTAKAGDQIHLPRGILGEMGYGKMLLKKPGVQEPAEFQYELKVPGTTYLPKLQLKIDAQVRSKTLSTLDPNPLIAQLDYDKIKNALSVRSRRPGDRFTPLGMNTQKKLKDFFIDEKVPRGQRNRVPIFISGDSIVWIGGFRIDDKFKITKDTKTILFLEIKEENDIAKRYKAGLDY